MKAGFSKHFMDAVFSAPATGRDTDNTQGIGVCALDSY